MNGQDKEMMQLLRTDYRGAFRLLYKEYFGMITYFVTRNSGNDADAEDVFQEIMIVLYDKSRDPGFVLTSSAKTFIYSIGRNIWLKKLRTLNRTVQLKDYEEYNEVRVEEEAEEPDMTQRIGKAMEQLGEKCRQILLLFYFEKKSMTEIATQLGYTGADNAKNQKYKCLQHLKGMLTTANA